MPVTNRQLHLIRQSFDALKSDLRPRSLEFYDRLFQEAPELRSLFREDLAGQGMRFMSTLSVLVDNLHDPAALDDRYVELGRVHAMLGVTAPMFVPMGRALIATLKDALGARFDAETEAAWTTAYADFSSEIVARSGIHAA